MRVTNRQGDAHGWSESASREGFDLIVAIGGDGTVGEVVSGQTRAERKIPIAIVPVGTANVVALSLSLPWLPGMAMSNILDGRALPFDVGYLPDHDRYFFLMAAIGYPARVIRDSPRRLKNLFGVFTYVGAAIRNALKLDQFRVFIEDEQELVWEGEGNTVLISNIGKIGDINLKLNPETSAHDGLFDIVVISSRSFWDAIQVLTRMFNWKQRATGRLQGFQAGKIVIATDPPVPVQIDGEELGMTPLRTEIIPHGVELIVGGRYREGAHDRAFMPDFKLPQGWLRR